MLVPSTSLQGSLAPHKTQRADPGLLSARDTALWGPGAGTHKWKPALSPLSASYLPMDKQGLQPCYQASSPFTRAHLTAHWSLHSFPKCSFLWSKRQALPQGEWCHQAEVRALQQSVFSPNSHIFHTDHIFHDWKSLYELQRNQAAHEIRLCWPQRQLDQQLQKESHSLLSNASKRGHQPAQRCENLRGFENWQEVNPPFMLPCWAQQPVHMHVFTGSLEIKWVSWAIPWTIQLLPLTNLPDEFSFRLWVFSSFIKVFSKCICMHSLSGFSVQGRQLRTHYYYYLYVNSEK